MDFNNILILLAFVFLVLLALFVRFRSSKTRANFIFELIIFEVALWTVSMFFYRLVPLGASIIWAKILYFAASLIAPTFFLFSLYFPKEKVSSWIVRITLVLIMLQAISSLFPNGVINFVEAVPNKERFIHFGFTYPLYVIHVAGFFLVAYLVLIRKLMEYQKKNQLIRLQIQYLLLSSALVSIGAMATNLFLPTLGIFTLNWLGQALTICWVVGISYVIMKHHLMDIRLVVARAVAYSFLVTIIGVFYVLATFFLSSFVLGFSTSEEQLLVYTVLTIFVALSFEKLKQLVEKITDNIFFKGRYDSNKLLSQLGSIMSTNIELDYLTTKILETLTAEMKVSFGTFVILEKKAIYKSIVVGNFKKNFSYSELEVLVKNGDIFIFDELDEGDLKQLMRSLGIVISKKLTVRDEVIGLLFLGEKSSGEIYSEQDLKVLDILGLEVAVAIQNAQSYDKIKKFNITLSEEVKKATVDLQWANLKLKELDKLKDDFVSVASHELRTPMTAIKSYLWMAINRPDVPLSEKMEQHLSRAYLSTERLINLVNDMLNVSRIEAGRIEIRPAPFDIQVLVSDVISEVVPKASEKMIKIEVEKENVPKVFADPDKVHEILLNLIGNSLKFTPAYGQITIRFFSDGQTVETSVKDTGSGISQDDLSSLFQKFGRLDNSYIAMSTAGGTGLGLYISKSLINLMKGRIWAASDGLNKGSTFTFSLPIATKEVLSKADQYTKTTISEAKELEPAAV